MANLISTQSVLSDRLHRQTQPKVLFADIDGTFFTAGPQIVRAPIYNTKTTSYLRAHDIPLILVTGRSDWQDIDKLQTQLLGIPQPDAVITACGSIMYERLANGIYARDLVWESQMHYTKVTRSDGTEETWNKLNVTRTVTNCLKQQATRFQLAQGNTFLIRIKVNRIDTKDLEQIRKDILALFPKGVRVVFTEKLLWHNTENIFSGDILIMPRIAGKENAVKYLLEKYAKQIKKPIHALIFGDATVDVGMLSMKDRPEYYSLSQNLINPTPLARKALSIEMKTNENIRIVDGDGPELIWRVVTGQPLIEKKQETAGEKQTQEAKQESKTKLSPAQNNPARQIIRKLEPLLDKLVDKNLSPNEVSFLGLTRLSQGLNLLYQQNSPIQRMKGYYHYGFGNLTDVLDGIRARNSDKREENGQLVDGFSDRAKEFMQLFIRAKRRIQTQKDETTQTLITALSCPLPSIARAQVEITGGLVPERDERGGSMIDRTKKLFASLLMDTIGAQSRSEAIDQNIYSSNMATFNHRLSYTKVPIREITDIKHTSLSDFQKKALERWLLYIDVLQQEETIIKDYLSDKPKLLKEYEKESQKLTKDYIKLDVNKLRKKYKIKDYQLHIKDYLR